MNSINTLQSCFCKAHFNVVHAFIVGVFHVILSFMFPYKNPVCISLLPHTCPAHLILHDVITVITFGGEYKCDMKDNTFKKFVILVLDM